MNGQQSGKSEKAEKFYPYTVDEKRDFIEEKFSLLVPERERLWASDRESISFTGRDAVDSRSLVKSTSSKGFKRSGVTAFKFKI